MKKHIHKSTSASRKLDLRSETLRQLTIEQLDDVAGAAPPISNVSCIKTHCTSSHDNGC
jgi:hypothetical protein